MMLTFGSSDTLLANTQVTNTQVYYVPIYRPAPQRTQGGGSRFYLLTNLNLM